MSRLSSILPKRRALLAGATTLQMSASAVAAGTCVLSASCDGNAACSDATMKVSWTSTGDDKISINDRFVPAQRFFDDMFVDEVNTGRTTWEIVQPGPSIVVNESDLLLVIVPTDGGVQASGLLSEMPRRSVDSQRALDNRVVFEGQCEGLF